MPSATAVPKKKRVIDCRLPVYMPRDKDGKTTKILSECKTCGNKNVEVPNNHFHHCVPCHKKGDGLAMQIVTEFEKSRICDFNRNNCSDEWDHSEMYNT